LLVAAILSALLVGSSSRSLLASRLYGSGFLVFVNGNLKTKIVGPIQINDNFFEFAHLTLLHFPAV
jgi:hypothetical protein